MKFPLGVLLLGLSYASFSVALAIAGAAPKRVLLPVAVEHYYAIQAAFVGPLFAALIALHTKIVVAILHQKAGPRTSFGEAYLVLGNAYAWPLLALFVVPDALVFALWGFDSIAKAMRFYAPVALLVILALSTIRARDLFGVTLPRALGAVFVGLVVQAMLGGLLLR